MKNIIKNLLISATCVYLLWWQWAQISPTELAALPVWQAVAVLLLVAVSFALSLLPAGAAILDQLEGTEAPK